MQDGEEPVVEPMLESLHADCIAGQPTGSGGAAERPDLLAQSGRVGAKSVSDEDDYLADDRRLPAKEEYLWMSCFGAHLAALFVALDELLPYVPAANRDFTRYLARARNHAEAIDKAFRFRLAFLRRLNELQVADVDEDVAVDAGVVAKPYLSTINTFFELHNLDPIAKLSLPVQFGGFGIGDNVVIADASHIGDAALVVGQAVAFLRAQHATLSEAGAFLSDPSGVSSTHSLYLVGASSIHQGLATPMEPDAGANVSAPMWAVKLRAAHTRVVTSVETRCSRI
eukprot:jgi/Tetstr1/439351/TSEL_027789.t1